MNSLHFEEDRDGMMVSFERKPKKVRTKQHNLKLEEALFTAELNRNSLKSRHPKAVYSMLRKLGYEWNEDLMIWIPF